MSSDQKFVKLDKSNDRYFHSELSTKNSFEKSLINEFNQKDNFLKYQKKRHKNIKEKVNDIFSNIKNENQSKTHSKITLPDLNCSSTIQSPSSLFNNTDFQID